MNRPTANDIYRAAQAFIREGQPVFPCYSRGERAKRPMTKHGFRDATTDKDKVKAWLKAHRDAALGIPTGIKYDVLDVDIKESADGRVHLPFLTRMGLLDGCVDVVRTPSGGWHLYFPTSHGLTNKARGATLGLDVRGTGGYVLAPPSYLTDVPKDDLDDSTYSGAYVRLDPPTGGKPGPLNWDLIVSALQPLNTRTNKPVEMLGYERQSSLASLRGWLSERTQGERNNALHWAVCRCIDNGIDPHELVDAALLIGLSEDETLLTINSALKRAGVTADDLDTEAEAMFPDE